MNTWNRFWFDRQDVTPLCVTRIGVGLLWCTLLFVLAANWHRYYGFDGMLSLGDLDLNERRTLSTWNLISLTDGVVPIELWWWIGIVLSVLVTLGYQTRWATIGLFLFSSTLIQRNNYIVNGEELVTRMLLFYGCFSPWGNRLTLDRWLLDRKQTVNSPEIMTATKLAPVWSWRLMQINFLMIYAISLPYKFAQDFDWLTGDALHWTIASDMWWTRGWLSDLTLGYNGMVRKAMTWGTVVVEALFPILVCFQRTRLVIVVCIIALHLGIALCIPGVTLFTLSMVVGAAMFVPVQSYQWCLRSQRPCADGESNSSAKVSNRLLRA